MRRATPLLLLALATAADAQDAGPRLRVADSVTIPFEVAEHRVVDTDGDGRDEVLVVGTAGEVRVVFRDEEGALRGPVGELTLADPARTLLAVARLTAGEGPTHLLALSPRGLVAYPVGARGAYAVRAIPLARRAAFTLRTGRPRFAPIARDVNGDGRTDVLVPRGDAVDLWIQEPPPETGAPGFRRTAGVRVDVRRDEEHAAEALTDVLESSFRIPQLAVRDVNGDGRNDLLVTDGELREFHLQRKDGSIPSEPDVRLDLELFRDTTPAADVRLGRTLAGSDEQRFEQADLNGDGIPDYVIAHRRKVWVFHGGAAGPQFGSPAAILKVAEDVTALLLVPLDERDDLADLLLVRVQVPSAAGLLRGLLAEWTVEIDAVGYRNEGDGTFARDPAEKGALAVRLPALLGVIRNPDRILQRFDDAASRFREPVAGDFDGDGTEDVALLAADDAVLEVWRGERSADPAVANERWIARVFFAGGEQEWDLDRILAFMGSLAERAVARLTGERPPDARATLRDAARHTRRGVAAARLDGRRHEILVAYRPRGTAAGLVIDALALE